MIQILFLDNRAERHVLMILWVEFILLGCQVCPLVNPEAEMELLDKSPLLELGMVISCFDCGQRQV